MTQDAKWEMHYTEILNYILTHKRRPSKHRIEDHLMLNWYKHHKKLWYSGKMPERRIPLFLHLMKVAEKYRKLNQSTYAYQNTTEGLLSL